MVSVKHFGLTELIFQDAIRRLHPIYFNVLSSVSCLLARVARLFHKDFSTRPLRSRGNNSRSTSSSICRWSILPEMKHVKSLTSTEHWGYGTLKCYQSRIKIRTVYTPCFHTQMMTHLIILLDQVIKEISNLQHSDVVSLQHSGNR